MFPSLTETHPRLIGSGNPVRSPARCLTIESSSISSLDFRAEAVPLLEYVLHQGQDVRAAQSEEHSTKT